MNNKKPKLPIILYEEDKNGTNQIPYIEVGLDEEMPKVLFISEYKQTGEFEASPEGSAEIVDMIIHKYVDLEYLKNTLDEKTNDKVRVALGMKPLKEAQQKGQKVLDKIIANAEKNKNNLINNPEVRKDRAFVLGEDFKKKAEEFLKKNKDEEV